MVVTEVRVMRNMLGEEWERQCWDAFMLPLDRLQLFPAEQKQYALMAIDSVHYIHWLSYDTVRITFRTCCDKLIRRFGRALDNKGEKQAKKDMYVRFMEGRIQFFQYKEKQENCQLPAIEVQEKDFHNVEMASVFAHLPAQPEIRNWLKPLDVSWDYDQLHMVNWFAGQLSLGSGKYSRSCPNHSAKKTYERLVNPYSLLWIAAAMGVERELMEKARKEMDEYTSWRAKCGAIRRAIPWKMIYELALPMIMEERRKV